MTEIMPFPENNCKTVLLDRPEGAIFYLMLIGFTQHEQKATLGPL